MAPCHLLCQLLNGCTSSSYSFDRLYGLLLMKSSSSLISLRDLYQLTRVPPPPLPFLWRLFVYMCQNGFWGCKFSAHSGSKRLLYCFNLYRLSIEVIWKCRKYFFWSCYFILSPKIFVKNHKYIPHILGKISYRSSVFLKNLNFKTKCYESKSSWNYARIKIQTRHHTKFCPIVYLICAFLLSLKA